MKNQIEKIKDIADGMISIGGIPSNEEFYAEFDMRVRAALGIHAVSNNEVAVACYTCKFERVNAELPPCSSCNKYNRYQQATDC